MASLIEIARELSTRTVQVRGQATEIRALSDRETAALIRMFPPPSAPVNMKDPTRGSLAPLVENPYDPEFLKADREWGLTRERLEVVVANGLAPITGNDGEDAPRLLAAAEAISRVLTREEISRVYLEIHRMHTLAEEKARAALIVDMAEVSPDQVREAAKLPAEFATTMAYLDLEVCARFGLAPWVYANADEAWKWIMRAFVGIKRDRGE